MFEGDGSCNNNNDSSIVYNMWLGLYPKQVQVKWQHSRDEHPRTQRWWKNDVKLEEKIEEMLREEPKRGPIPNCRTMYPIGNCRVTNINNLILTERHTNQISPILNGRTDIRIGHKLNNMSNSSPIFEMKLIICL